MESSSLVSAASSNIVDFQLGAATAGAAAASPNADELLQLRAEALSRIAENICAKRSRAVNARVASGIEQIWEYCENAFNSVDPNVDGGKTIYKPQSSGGPFIYANRSSSTNDASWSRSTAFFNITAPYVLSAASKLHQMLFPTDQRSWDLKPTPYQAVDELASWLETSQIEAEELESFVGGVKKTTKDEIKEVQTQIDDWLRESPQPFADVASEVLEDAARIGTLLLEGPVPAVTEKGIQPVVLAADVKELYPDENCGENIQDGDFLFRRQMKGARKLRELAEKGEALGWQKSALLEVLEEGPQWYAGSGAAVQKTKTQPYELWTYQGEVPKLLLVECNCKLPTDADATVWANVTLINDKICRVGVGLLPGKFSLRTMPWRKRKGHWAGIGVAEDLEDTQRSLNAQVRNLQDNSALSAIPQIVYWKGKLIAANGEYELSPGKKWYLNDDSESWAPHVKNAIFTIEIPCRLVELRENISLFLSLAEQVTGISGVFRGMEQPSSVGGGQLQIDSGGSTTRRGARLWDSNALRPLIQDFVAFRNKFRGSDVPLIDTNVAVYGSTVLVERDMQAQAAIQAVNFSANPMFGHDPEAMMDQWLLANKFDPRQTKLSVERKAEMQATTQAQEGDDGKAAAAQAVVASAQLRANALAEQTRVEGENDKLKTAGMLENEARKREHAERMLMLKSKIELTAYAAKKGIDLSSAMEEFRELEWPKEQLQTVKESAGAPSAGAENAGG